MLTIIFKNKIVLLIHWCMHYVSYYIEWLIG